MFNKIVFPISSICICFFVNYGLSKEAIIGGVLAPPIDFSYHVSVEGIKNYTNIFTPLGNGAIISNKFVLTVANVFLLINGQLQERRFSIVAGSHNLSSTLAFRIDIESIFFPKIDPTFIFVNLAVAKLTRSVGLGKNLFVSKVELPSGGLTFDNLEAMVSGFGCTRTKRDIDAITGLPALLSGPLCPLLRFRNILILPDYECAYRYPKEFMLSNMCGKVLRNYPGEVAGVCFGDIGDPLVLGKTILGLVSSITPDCNDTVKGALYVKVSLFVNDIIGFVDGSTNRDALIYPNRVYIPPKSA